MTGRELILWALRKHAGEDLSADDVLFVLSRAKMPYLGKVTRNNVRVLLRVLEEDGFVQSIEDGDGYVRVVWRLVERPAAVASAP